MEMQAALHGKERALEEYLKRYPLNPVEPVAFSPLGTKEVGTLPPQTAERAAFGRAPTPQTFPLEGKPIAPVLDVIF